MTIVYAEEINYWKTSQSAADTWIEKAKGEIRSIGGKIAREGFMSLADGRAAFMMEFVLGTDSFRIEWAILPSRTKNEKAAKIQAATILYHDVKHKVVMAKVKGVRTSFMEYFLLPGGQIAGQAIAADTDFLNLLPDTPLLGSGKR